MKSTRFVPSNLTFSENSRCLNLQLKLGVVSQKRLLTSSYFVIAGQRVHSGKLKQIKYAENVNFERTDTMHPTSVLTEASV